MNTRMPYLTPNQPPTKQRLRHLGQCLLACLLAAMGLLLVFLMVSPVHADGPINLDPVANWFDLYNCPRSGDKEMAWGDIDGDGDLDLAINCNSTLSVYIYAEELGTLRPTPLWTPSEPLEWGKHWTYPAWGDVEGDGDLDLAVRSPFTPYLRLYLNVGGTLQPNPTSWNPIDPGEGPLAWADMDGNGYLDLAVGQVVYTNTGGVLQNDWAWRAMDKNPANRATSVVWGDMDNDGDLDLAVGDIYGVGLNTKVYKNEAGLLQNPWEFEFPGNAWTLAWGDVNDDGYPELAGGDLLLKPIWYYRNITGVLTSTQTWLSTENQYTIRLAWGDVDSDGDLDLASGASNDSPDRVYLNETGVLSKTAAWQSAYTTRSTDLEWIDLDGDRDLDFVVADTANVPRVHFNESKPLSSTLPLPVAGGAVTSMAWGDMDNDGDLDLAVGNQIYENVGGGMLQLTPWIPAGPGGTFSVAWGDVDSDGDLDLAVGNANAPNALYLNDGGNVQTTPVWSSANTVDTRSVAWGDVDGDGDLDLAVGNVAVWDSGCQCYVDGENELYLNESGTLQPTPVWTDMVHDNTYSIAWGDVDGDGDLDLAVGNAWGVALNKIYLNEAGTLQTPAFWSSTDGSTTYSLAWGDMNGDGKLDLAAGNQDQPNTVYLNIGGTLERIASWISPDADYTWSIAWGDVDGDGDLDLAAGNGGSGSGSAADSNKIYANTGDTLETAWTSPEVIDTFSVAWGDVDGDGDLDLATREYGKIRLYLNGVHGSAPHGSQHSLALSTAPAPADFYAVSRIWGPGQIPFSYTLFHPSRDFIGRVQAFYSPAGGGQWYPALATDDTKTQNLAAGPYPTVTVANTHVFTWDVAASGFFGQSDNVVLRLKASPISCCDNITGTYRFTNTIPGPYQWPYASAQTFPFRVRGTQVRVVDQANDPMPNSLVYRLPQGDQTGGYLIGTTITQPFVTDEQGFLQGRGQINIGDHLLALAPVPLPPKITERYSNTLRLYYTNGVVNETGVTAHEVITPGVQELVVSADNPLLLFDLDVSLEWDASHDPGYLPQLEFDLKRAAQYLYDFTDGQVALGNINVSQNADDWAFAHVDVHATNRLRPFATIGGVVLTDTVDINPTLAISYSIGQVNMGATWNRYGNPGQNIGVDWPLILAHELGHYLLYLDDTYLGLNNDDLLIAIGDCTGSAMGDVYAEGNTEFVSDDNHWSNDCGQTLTERTVERDEWETIEGWYPWLHTPAITNNGPSLMPFELTTVQVWPPLTPTSTLADPTFFLDYTGGNTVVSSSEARAFLFRDEEGNTGNGPDDFEFVYNLGSPVGGQNRLLARGAQPGDRLCVFDQPRAQYGCEIIEAGDERLSLEQDTSWTPVIQISPVNSTTFTVNVDGLPAGLVLNARLYPEFGSGSAIFPVDNVSPAGGYSGTITLDDPALTGDVQLWVNEMAAETDPRRETIVSYSIGGNPGLKRGGGGLKRGGGGLKRGGGGLKRGGGGLKRGGGAPLVSPDGQMIFFTVDELPFDEGEFYTVQNMAGLPPLPDDKIAIGQGYNLFATSGAPELTGSISFQYLSNDVLVEGQDENELTIHHWDGSQWRTLETLRDPYFNLVSAPSVGAGIYALLAGVTTPGITAVDPPIAINNITNTLTITGGYFLEPLTVALVGPSATYYLPYQWVSTTTLTAVVPQGMEAREYQVKVANLNQPGGPAVSNPPGTFALFDPADACFYDFFESGPGKWQRDGEWDIVILSNGERAMTDSPLGPYNNANPPAKTRTTSVTSEEFSLAGCVNPMLTFRHDYVIAQIGDSQDMGRVEISADNGNSWTELASFSGGGVFGVSPQDITSPEWPNPPNWQDVGISLNAYADSDVRLRLSLEVDQTVSDKGWLIDNMMVMSGTPPIFLPFIIKQGPGPDLVGSFSLSPSKLDFTAGEPVQINVTVTNRGTEPAANFLVDFYINPSPPPTTANVPWDTVCSLEPCHGLSWFVKDTLEPGQSIVLTSTPDSYDPSFTVWPGYFVNGTSDLYLYVDSWNQGVSVGAVAESLETNNRAERHGLVVTGPNLIGAGASPPPELPPRPGGP